MGFASAYARAVFVVRFDFRLAPHSSATMGELYRAALDMTVWAENNRAVTVMFSEHHGSPDGYLPSPLVLAAAATARTSTVSISVGALLAVLYDPIKLAEDIAVLHHLSGGRVGYTIGLGYRPEEYAMFGVDAGRRGAELEERIDVVRRALTGERFAWRGRPVAVTPAVDPLPFLAYGGGSLAAARRAARLGMVFIPQTNAPTLTEAYNAEATRVGTTPGMVFAPSAGAPTTVFVANDVDRAWDDIGTYLLHDARTYADWMGPGNNSASYTSATTVGELRAENGPYRIVTPADAIELVRRHGMLSLQPLCGGIPPEVAWPYLRTLEAAVLPNL